MTPLLLALSLAQPACSGDDTTDDSATTDTDTDTDTTDPVWEAKITVTGPAAGDLSCYGAGDPWNSDSADATCVAEIVVRGAALDWETGDAVPSPSLTVHENDDPATPPSGLVSGAVDGRYSSKINACSPLSVKVEATDHVPTLHTHLVAPPITPLDGDLTSIHSTTHAVITALFGVSVDSARGTALGQVLGCDGNPVEGAQLIVRDASGSYDPTHVVGYFADSFPDRNQEWTSADGYFVVMNAPVGATTVEAWLVDSAGSTPTLWGEVPSFVEAGTVTVNNLHLGQADGYDWHPDCLTPCTW